MNRMLVYNTSEIGSFLNFIQDQSHTFEKAYDLLEEKKFLQLALSGDQYQKHTFEHVYRDPHEDRDIIMLHGRLCHGGYTGVDISEHEFVIADLMHFYRWYYQVENEVKILRESVKEIKEKQREMQVRENAALVKRYQKRHHWKKDA